MPATRKHLHVSKPRRRQRSVSLTTRASRCGVKNFVNVLKSLHPQVEDFFPVTKEYMEEYISVKRKQGSIKANSLDQYFQHIESYNMALGHVWEAEIFEPMMREVLEDLEKAEEKARAERKLIMGEDAVDMTGIEHDQENHIMGDVDSTDNNNNIGPSVPLVCFDTSHTPLIKLENTARVSLINIDKSDISIAIRQLKDLVAKTKFPKRWGEVDTSTIYYRNETWHDSQHFPLTDENAFQAFWSAFIEPAEGGEAQLIVYAKRSPVTKAPLVIGTDIDQSSTPLPLAPLTPRKSPPRLSSSVNNIDTISESPAPSPTFPQVKAVTIRSPTKIYKSNIAVTDGTTFENLLKFAIPKLPPPGKQFVLQSADGELEFMPDDTVRKVICGTPHAEVIVRVEDVKDIDFSEF